LLFFGLPVFAALTTSDRVGKVKVAYCNGDKFEGEFYRGEKMGQGSMWFAKGDTLLYAVRNSTAITAWIPCTVLTNINRWLIFRVNGGVEEKKVTERRLTDEARSSRACFLMETACWNHLRPISCTRTPHSILGTKKPMRSERPNVGNVY
jgi:hypothetical protein